LFGPGALPTDRPEPSFSFAAVAEGVSPELVAAAETTLAHCFFTVLENVGPLASVPLASAARPAVCPCATAPHCRSASPQAGKMPVGRVRTVCAEYGSVKLVHASLSPLTLCLVGSPRSDIAELQAVGAELARSLAPMQAAADTLTRREDA